MLWSRSGRDWDSASVPSEVPKEHTSDVRRPSNGLKLPCVQMSRTLAIHSHFYCDFVLLSSSRY